jgi:hypothetical protein
MKQMLPVTPGRNLNWWQFKQGFDIIVELKGLVFWKSGT